MDFYKNKINKIIKRVFIQQTIIKRIYFLIFGALVFVFSCSDFKKNTTHAKMPDYNIESGKLLAAKYCQSCHLLPDPSLLNARMWEEGVLPAMGPRLGINDYGFIHYSSSRNDKNLDKNYYPSKPVLSIQEWRYIMDYYTSVSPDTLPSQQRTTTIKNGASLFKIEIPVYKHSLPTTCFVEIDTSTAIKKVVISDMLTKNILRFSADLTLLDSFKNVSPVVDIERDGDGFITCNIGEMGPNNGKFGSAAHLAFSPARSYNADTTEMFNNLARPVQITPADFNKDGKTDYLVCEFGNLMGSLSWMENLGKGKFERHVLRGLPGAIKAYIKDVNNDGLPDIWVLFSQGDEGIFLFTNKGNGKFEQEEVLRFPSIYGSSYFELADFNKDGFPDIVYTSGDNADFSAVLKPYHGVYIFMNDGKNHFKQEYFFPMYGCFKAIARDFDGDGDLDIAAISFFADYAKHPEESFIYLENKGKMDFQPYILPGTNTGRWLTMDAADLDGDGKTDLILGNFSLAPASLKSAINWKEGPPFVVFKNIIKNK